MERVKFICRAAEEWDIGYKLRRLINKMRGIRDAARHYGIYPWKRIPGLWEFCAKAVKTRRVSFSQIAKMGVKTPEILRPVELNFFLCPRKEVRSFIRGIVRSPAEGIKSEEIKDLVLSSISKKLDELAEQVAMAKELALNEFLGQSGEVLEFMRALRLDDTHLDNLINAIWGEFDKLDEKLNANFQKGLYADSQAERELQSIVASVAAIRDFLDKFDLERPLIFHCNELNTRADNIIKARQRRYKIENKMHEEKNAPILPPFVGVKFISDQKTLLARKEIKWIFYTPGTGLLSDISDPDLQKQTFEPTGYNSILAYLHVLYLKSNTDIQVQISRKPEGLGQFSVNWRLNEDMEWTLVDCFSLQEIAEAQNEDWVSFYGRDKN
jgi:hypothetical protein